MEKQTNNLKSLVQWGVGFLMGIIVGIFIGAALQSYFPQVFDWLVMP